MLLVGRPDDLSNPLLAPPVDDALDLEAFAPLSEVPPLGISEQEFRCEISASLGYEYFVDVQTTKTTCE